jgi:hypothetical protein
MSSAAEAEIGAVFNKCQGRSSPSNNIGRIRTPSASHTNGDRQYHRHRLQQWHNKTKTHKRNGYAFLLDQRQSKTRTISCVLGHGLPKCGRLFHKTSFAGASQKNARHINSCQRTADKSERNSRFRIARVC